MTTRKPRVRRGEIPDTLKSAPGDKKLTTWRKTKEKLLTPVEKPKNRPLSAQEWRFVQEIVSSFGEITLKEAAIRAGYDPNKAKARAAELTDPRASPHIVAAIQEMRQEMAEVYGTTYERHMRDLQRIRDAAMQAGNYGAAVQAEFRRGQALGTIYVERKEVRYGTIDSMSKEEVMKELERLKDVYGTPGSIIELTQEQIEQSLEQEKRQYGGEPGDLALPAPEGQSAGNLPDNED
jgi:phage terminase small subunit